MSNGKWGPHPPASTPWSLDPGIVPVGDTAPSTDL